MRWQLTKVRVANIRPEIREELERAGEAVIANALAVPLDVESSPFHKFRHEERPAAEAWLIERRDIAQRNDQRAEWWIGIGSLAAIVAAVAAVAAVIVGIRSCSYSSSNYEAQNRPQLQTGNYSSDADDLFSWQVWNSGNEDARDIRFKFAGIDSGMHSATPLTPESASLWPRLPKFGTYENDWVKIRVSRSNFPYLLVCVDYKGERSQPFPADDNFLALADWRPNMANLTSPPRPALAEADKLRAKFSCATL